MSTAITYPAQLDFNAEHRIARWRPLVHWLLAIPQLAIARVLGYLRNVLTLISLFTVLFTKRIPRPIFDAIAMVYRYEWRALSYALFLHEDYPPFDFTVGADDNRVEPHTTLSIFSELDYDLEARVSNSDQLSRVGDVALLLVRPAVSVKVGMPSWTVWARRTVI